MEQQIQETSLKFREMVDRALVGIFRTTLAGQIVDANPVLLKTLRFDSIEHANQVGLLNLYVDDADRNRLLAALRQGQFPTLRPVSGVAMERSSRFLSARTWSWTRKAPPSSSRERWRISPSASGGGVAAESEERFRSVVENSPTGIFIVNDVSKFIYANDQLCRIVDTPKRRSSVTISPSSWMRRAGRSL